MSFNELEIKRIEKETENFLKKRRPPIEIRNKVDIGFKIDNNNVEIFEIRPQWNNPNIINEIPIAKTTFIKSKNIWKIFWKRSDLKWHIYDPNAEVKTINEFLLIIDKDEHGCFWG